MNNSVIERIKELPVHVNQQIYCLEYYDDHVEVVPKRITRIQIDINQKNVNNPTVQICTEDRQYSDIKLNEDWFPDKDRAKEVAEEKTAMKQKTLQLKQEMEAKRNAELIEKYSTVSNKQLLRCVSICTGFDDRRGCDTCEFSNNGEGDCMKALLFILEDRLSR